MLYHLHAFTKCYAHLALGAYNITKLTLRFHCTAAYIHIYHMCECMHLYTGTLKLYKLAKRTKNSFFPIKSKDLDLISSLSHSLLARPFDACGIPLYKLFSFQVSIKSTAKLLRSSRKFYV